MRHRAETLVALSAAWLLMPGAVAQPEFASPEVSTEQFEQLWQSSVAWHPTPGTRYHLRHSWFATMSEAEARQRLSQITQFPHHPERLSLERELAKAVDGPEVSEYWVWIDANGDIRFSTTTTAPAGQTWSDDTVVAAAARWQMVELSRQRGVLIVLDPRSPPPPDRDLGARVQVGIDAIAALANGGLVPSLYGSFTPSRVEQIDGRTVGVAVLRTSELRVTLEEIAGDLRPVMVTAQDTSTGRAWLRARVSGWEPPDSQIARLWERLAPDNTVLEAIELIEVRPLAAGEFAPLASVPPADGADVFRGPSTYSIVWDYRPGAGTYSVSQNGASVTTPIPPAALGTALSRSWNWTGPALAAAVLATLCLIRWWRGRAPAASSAQPSDHART